MTLPLKTRILEYAILAEEPFTAEGLTEILKKEYPGERFCNEKHIDETIGSYCGVNFIEPAKLELKENNELYVEYRATETGKKYINRIPGHFDK